MNIVFNKLTIENFMSIGKLELEFNKLGYVLVEGKNASTTDNAKSNGSGKSSVWEALTWCLTGDTIRGCKNVQNLNSKEGALVTVEFLLDNNFFIITRAKNHSIYKSNLLINFNGQDVSGKGIKESTNILQSYLGDLTATVINSVIILGQGLPSKFTNNTPSGRKEILESLSKSDFMINDLKERIQKREIELKTDLRSQQDLQISNNSKLDLLNKQLQSYQQELQTLPSKVTLSEKNNTILADLQITQEQLIHKRNDLNSLLQQKTSIQESQLSIAAKQQAEIVNVEEEFNEIINPLGVEIAQVQTQINYLQNHILEVNNIKDICPTCGQHLPNVFKPDVSKEIEDINSLKNSLNELNTKKAEHLQNKTTLINNIKGKYTLQINNLQQEYTKQENIISELNTSITELTNKEKYLLTNQANILSQIQTLDELSNRLSNSIAITNTQIEDLTKEVSKISANISKLNQRLDIIKKFDTIIKRDFRGYLLKEVIAYIDKKAKEYSLQVFGHSCLDILLEGNNISIVYINKEYEMLSGGEKQKLDLIIQFALRDMLCKYLNFSCNILVLDEIFDNLDSTGCDSIISLILHSLKDIENVFIISHHAEELNIPSDITLTIEKNKEGNSYLRYAV